MGSPQEVRDLVKQFRRNEFAYLKPAYVEASLRQEYLDPLFIHLGWDVGNTQGWADENKEVAVEPSVRIDGRHKVPDYAFRVGPQPKFYVEAKRPSVGVASNKEAALQIRGYGWNKRMPLCILTDFRHWAVYNTLIEPAPNDRHDRARIEFFGFEELDQRWEWLEETFGRDSVWKGSLDAFARSASFRRGTAPVDSVFLREIERWRVELGGEIARKNREVPLQDLNMAVQLLIDRIIFLRICEDRGIEPYKSLHAITKSKNIYSHLSGMFVKADSRFNSGLFHFRSERGRNGTPDQLTPGLVIGDRVLRDLILGLYPPESPFDFSVIGVELLGQVYEEFLGSVIELTPGRQIRIEQKPVVKKAGGVVYTPRSVVQFIIGETVSKALEGATLDAVAGKGRGKSAHPLRVLDPACGSGSFLIDVYQRLLDWHHDWYMREPAKWAKGTRARVRPSGADTWDLTTAERKRILLTHVFGVDIDAQAVEVAKLSLLLKVLEGETDETIGEQMAAFQERALPDLDQNIKCGNSLIDLDYVDVDPAVNTDSARRTLINMFSWKQEFIDVFDGPAQGFDVVLGNPPYVLLQDEFRDDLQLEYFKDRYAVSSYKLDLYHLFLERSTELTRHGGWFSMITPTNYMTNNHLGTLRRTLLEQSEIASITVIDKAVFPQRSVDTAVVVARPGHTTSAPFAVCHAEPAAHEGLDVGPAGYVDPVRALQDEHSLFTGAASDGVTEALEVMLAVGRPLGKLAKVNFGKQLRNRKVFTDDVITLNPGDQPPAGYAECYTGRDVHRWDVRWGGRYLLDKEEARKGGCWDKDAQNAVNKLLTPQIGRVPHFGIDEVGRQCLNTMFMINVRDAAVDPWYLLGVLNSTPVRAFWLDRFYDQRQTFPKIKGTYLKALPVPSAGKAEAEAVAVSAQILVELHRELRKAAGTQDRARLERSISSEESRLDGSVERLFTLTPTQAAELREFAKL